MIINFTQDGLLAAADEIETLGLTTPTIITRFAPRVAVMPSGGTIVLRVQDASGGSPTAFIEATIADGTAAVAATGSVAIAAGASIYVRVQSNSGGAESLGGYFEIERSIGVVTGTDLCTIQNVKDYLAISTSDDDALLQQIVSGVSDAIQTLLNRTFASTVHVAETHSGDGENLLALRHRPVTAISAIRVDGGAIDLTEIKRDDPAGLIFWPSGVFTRGVMNVEADYTSEEAVPPAVRDAAIIQSAFELKQTHVKGNRLGFSAETIADSVNSYVVADWAPGVRAKCDPHTHLRMFL